MRIVKDKEGDFWEEVKPDGFLCGENEGITRSFQYIETNYGVDRVFETRSTPDTSVYRVTLWNGQVKVGDRRRLAALKAYHGLGVAQIERCYPEWTDVTPEFMA